MNVLPEIYVSSVGRDALQLPHLPDPGKTDDDFSSDRLGFTIRLGKSLARGSELDEKVSIHKELSRKFTTPSEATDDTQDQWLTTSSHDAAGDRFKYHPHETSKGTRKKKDLRRGSTVTNLPRSYITEESPRMKFQRVAKTVRLISGVCLALKRYVKKNETKTWSFMEMYLHVKADLHEQLAFNPHNFGRIEPEMVRLRKLLAIPKGYRTVDHIRVILALLRGNASFQDYPGNVQIQLAKCMEYESYEARRMILKQGHRPEAFYIILSGSVLANIQDTSPTTGKTFVRTVHEMSAGDTFGEIALIEDCMRTASIICKTSVELLVIMKDDFDAIIRTPLTRQMEDHIAFCKSMPLLQDFPCDKLASQPRHFFYQYFSKGSIIVHDSQESKHLVIIKAGKCRMVTSFVEKGHSKRSAGSAFTREQEKAFPLYTEMQKISLKTQRPRSEGNQLRIKENICIGLLTGTIDKIKLADYGPDYQRKSAKLREKEERAVPPLKKSKTLSSFYDKMAMERKQNADYDESANFEETFWATRLHGPDLKARKKEKEFSSVATSVRCSSSRRSKGKCSNPFYRKEKTAHAQVAELHAGSVFGMESLMQKPTTKFCLISDGSECIFLSKRLFLSLANIKVLRRVSDMVQIFPSQEFIEEQVKHYRSWQKYKSSLVQDVLKRRRQTERSFVGGIAQ
ncbi:hypothetical protein ACJMK2_032387 [Sinanodonta woodiana]|uniref:Cyclic nucleotide-binding domain-containing protein n=1 Tax=Sinanodonta woodiana TaxID=1069815 RepID=A0ABD3X546_SINWO